MTAQTTPFPPQPPSKNELPDFESNPDMFMETAEIPGDHLTYRDSLVFFEADGGPVDSVIEQNLAQHLGQCQDCRRGLFERIKNCAPSAPQERDDSSVNQAAEIEFLHDAIFDLEVVATGGPPLVAWLRRLRASPALLARLMEYRKTQLPSDAQIEKLMKRFGSKKWCHEAGALKIELRPSENRPDQLDAVAMFDVENTLEKPLAIQAIDPDRKEETLRFSVAALAQDPNAPNPVDWEASFDLSGDTPVLLMDLPRSAARPVEVGLEYANGGHGPTTLIEPGDTLAVELFPAPASLLLHAPGSALPLRLALAVSDRYGPL